LAKGATLENKQMNDLVQNELDRIGTALRQSGPVPRYDELYVAQQALMWALDPSTFKAPYDLIAPVSGIPEGSEGCLEESGRSAFSDNHDHRVSEPSPTPISLAR
jgi:hypothetical protein